jgi:hypothetical protein
MKQILFMMPSYYNFDEVVKNGLIKYSGHGVNGIDTVGRQAYRNFSDRVINFLSKIFLNKNLKPEMKRKLFFSKIDEFEEYAYLIVNRPDIISEEVLTKALTKSKKSILLLWDSLEKVPIALDTIARFDRTYSFDNQDCQRHGFAKIENFHFISSNLVVPPFKYDVVFLGTLDNRITALKAILANLVAEQKTVKAFIYVPPRKHMKKYPDIEILNKITPFKDSCQFSLLGNVILDLGHENQRGLSFRVFEAMALHKKLITTNKQVRNYDFYDENNIFVVDDVADFEIPKLFWNSAYIEIPALLKEKYHIKHWVDKILDEK